MQNEALGGERPGRPAADAHTDSARGGLQGTRDTRLLSTYEEAELGGRVGLGSRPAVLVVDFQNCFVDPQVPGGADFSEAISQTQVALEFARRHGMPVVFSRVAYREDLSDAGLFIEKCPSLRLARLGTPNVDIDSRLARQHNERIVTKRFASAFHGTLLAAELRVDGIDTLVVCGCTTSGCVRATVVDALQYGFRTVVPEECVADLDPAPHKANLFDIDAKYGDVVRLGQLLADLAAIMS